MLFLDWLVVRTKWGRGMRALRENRQAPMLMGVDIDRTVALTFFIGVALAGVGGVLVGPLLHPDDFLLGWSLGLKAFAAAVLGGIGNIRGAMLGGLLLGIIEALGTTDPLPYRRLRLRHRLQGRDRLPRAGRRPDLEADRHPRRARR